VRAIRLFQVLLPVLLLWACEKPPADAYVQGVQVGGGKPAAQVSIGKNSVGEDCTQ
jgi:hypothetical protein